MQGFKPLRQFHQLQLIFIVHCFLCKIVNIIYQNIRDIEKRQQQMIEYFFNFKKGKPYRYTSQRNPLVNIKTFCYFCKEVLQNQDCVNSVSPQSAQRLQKPHFASYFGKELKLRWVIFFSLCIILAGDSNPTGPIHVVRVQPVPNKTYTNIR